jgi:hypothetical protein
MAGFGRAPNISGIISRLNERKEQQVALLWKVTRMQPVLHHTLHITLPPLRIRKPEVVVHLLKW